MQAIVLGSAAGGGFPQWNSHGVGCRRARAGDPKAIPRTQASLAVSADGERWTVINASPDLRQQIEANPELHPRSGTRSSPIGAVVLTGGEVDAIAGLLTLRERQPFTLYATAPVHAILDANPIFGVLARDVVDRRTMPMDRECHVSYPNDVFSGLAVTSFAVPGKLPLYLEQGSLEQSGAFSDLTESEQTVGVGISAGGDTLFYIPGCAAMTPILADRLRNAAVVLFDGTLWTDDEMVRTGISQKTGQRMGHMSVSGPDGALAAFSELGVRQRVLVHINNSNPILLDDSPERAEVGSAGWQVAFDGLELRL